MPCSATFPSFKRTSLSAPSTVRMRCAMMSTVLPLTRRETARWTSVSLSASSDAVASSSRMTGASFRSARAIEMRWRSPPERAEPFSPIGVRLKGRPNLRASGLIVNGLADVQDEGSQIVSLLTRAKAGETVIDWCAGAGGKTLALAAIMENKGAIYAADANPRRLKDLPDRAVRAGVRNVVLLNGYDALKTYDLVLVDAPCSGTGTWRRAPDARWRTTAETVKKLTAVQEDILEKACRYVRKGGRLFYITCSLLREENENRAERFLSAHPEFISEDLAPVLKEKTGIETTEKTVRLFPSVHGTDGFFAASFLRI